MIPKSTIFIIAALLIISAIIYLEKQKPTRRVQSQNKKIAIQPRLTDVLSATDLATKTQRYKRANELVNPSGFLNSEPFKLADIVGKKVILIDFWTYSCINCQRTMPYLNAWYEKYQNQGLEIIGVHTPEFEFEKNRDNVAKAMQKFGIKYPVVQDNDYGIWTAYGNRYWPRKYLIDIDGFIVYDHIGEGLYDETEKKIQELLAERADRFNIDSQATSAAIPKNIVSVDFSQVKSPETYFGAGRNENLGNGIASFIGEKIFIEPENIFPNKLYLVGNWNIQFEYAETKSKNSKILFRFNAKNVYLVASAFAETPVKIMLDGKLLKTINIKAEELYSVVELADYGEHILELIIEQDGLKAFAFTFG